MTKTSLINYCLFYVTYTSFQGHKNTKDYRWKLSWSFQEVGLSGQLLLPPDMVDTLRRDILGQFNIYVNEPQASQHCFSFTSHPSMANSSAMMTGHLANSLLHTLADIEKGDGLLGISSLLKYGESIDFKSIKHPVGFVVLFVLQGVFIYLVRHRVWYHGVNRVS
jgi:hypothetical protein